MNDHPFSLSQRVLNLKESATIAMAAQARELKEMGKDIVDMSLGEPDLDPPDFILNAAREAIDKKISNYSPVPGLPSLRKAISRKLKRDNGLDFEENQIVVSTGAKQSIMNIVLSLINPGDKVIIPAPYWVSYRDMVQFVGGKVISLSTSIESDYKISPLQLKESLNKDVKLFIFSNPSNPSGMFYSEEELAEFAKIFSEYPNCLIISDEIYEHLCYDSAHYSLARFKEISGQVITVNGLSKAFCVTGWRIGYCAAPVEVAKACSKIQGQFTSGANVIGQYASAIALEEDPQKLKSMVNEFKRRRDLFCSELEEFPYIKFKKPQGAFYLFMDVSETYGKSFEGQKISDSQDFCRLLLSSAYIASTPGAAFGTPECARFSYACSEDDIRKCASRLKTFLSQLT
ncbi:pyridoxal phosphate-dependent aminotransferase [Bacteriovoracaceae bacterium]|nr:pyridoxal phosphate-dependent aminotransferase [Bacteriovoracaceae bacterium]